MTNISFREKCDLLGANYETARRNRNRFKDKTDEEIIEYTLNRQRDVLKAHIINKYCKENNISRSKSYKIRQQYKSAGIEELIEILETPIAKIKCYSDTFKTKCEQLGLDYNMVKGYKRLHPELTDEQIIEYYIQKYSTSKNKDKKLGLKDTCRKLNINYQSLWRYKQRHPGQTNEQLIQYFLQPKQKSFKEKCKQANIDYERARGYKKIHPELTEEQVIIYYKPECYINCLGKLVVP